MAEMRERERGEIEREREKQKSKWPNRAERKESIVKYVKVHRKKLTKPK